MRARQVLLMLAVSALTTSVAAAQQLQYPPAPKGDVTDDYFGRHVADPYRSLEDLDAPATKAWVAAENALAPEGTRALAGKPLALETQRFPNGSYP